MKLPVNSVLPLAVLLVLGGCGMAATGTDRIPAMSAKAGPAADYPMVLGAPYVVDGVTYTPADRLNSDEVGYAGLDGMAAGVSAAHKTLPLPSYVEVTSLDSGRTILVRLEKRGPLTNDRLIDLSPAAVEQLGAVGAQRMAVRVRRVNPPETERALLRSGQPAMPRMDTPRPLLDVLMRKLRASQPVVPAPVDKPAVSAVPVSRDTAQPVSPARPPATARPVTATAPARKPPESAAAQAASRSPATARPAAAVQGGLVVQVGAFSNRARAETVARRVGGRVESRGNLWRVRSGPFATRAQADVALAKAKAAGYGDARIQRVD